MMNRLMVRMVRANARSYRFYLVCNVLAVAVLFSYATLFFNPGVVAVKESESLQYVFTIPGVALVVFVMIFTGHAHRLFNRRRVREFGVFLSIGMTGREVMRLVLIENVLVGIVASGLGLLAGGLLGQVLFGILNRAVGLGELPFRLTGEMIFTTVGLYGVVLGAVVVWTFVQLSRGSVVEHLKSERRGDAVAEGSPVLGVVGLGLVVIAVLGLYGSYASAVGGDLLVLWVVVALGGLFLSVGQWAGLLVRRMRGGSVRGTGWLSLTNLAYTFRQLTSSVMLVTVMVMVTVLYGSILLFTYVDGREAAVESAPYSVAFVQNEAAGLSESEVRGAASSEGLTVTEYRQAVVRTRELRESDGWVTAQHVMSSDAFFELSGREMEVADGKFVYVMNQRDEHGAATLDSYGVPFVESGEGELVMQEVLVDQVMNPLPAMGDFIVVNEREYTAFESGVESEVVMLSVDKWKETAGYVSWLDEAISAQERDRTVLAENVTGVTSRLGAVERNLEVNGISLFVTLYLGIVFFGGSFAVLFMNLMAGVEREKRRFRALFRIGSTASEYSGMVKRELAVICFTPTLLGIGMSLLFLVGMATDIGGVLANPGTMVFFVVVSFVYVVCMGVGYKFLQLRFETEVKS